MPDRENPPTELGPGDWGAPPNPPDTDDIAPDQNALINWSADFTVYLKKLLAHNPHSIVCKDSDCRWCNDVGRALKPQMGVADRIESVARRGMPPSGESP
jgi:hypothetical protein